MIDQIFAVHDSKADAYLPPFFMHNQQMAIRTFSDCVNAADHTFNHHPDDYTLFHLGEFDNEQALLLPRSAPLSLGNGVEFISHQISGNENAEGSNQISDDTQRFQHPASGHP